MQQEKTMSSLSGFARFLVLHHHLTEESVFEAFNEAAQQNSSFILYLGQHKLLSYNTLAKITAHYFGLPLFDLTRYDKNFLPENIFTQEYIKKHTVLPLCQQGKQLLLAVADPALVNINEMSLLTGLTITLIIVVADKLKNMLDEIFSNHLQVAHSIENITNDEDQLEYHEAPIIQFINTIILDAIQNNASDIHFEPYEHYYRVRYRIDGILYEINQHPIQLATYFTARLKIMANLDISERRIPQDGRFKMSIAKNRNIDFRVSTCPTLFGEKTVLRISESANKILKIESLGMLPHQIQLFQNALKSTQGLILVTGPTGSGKTVTLYTALNTLNSLSVNIATAEDPVEVYLPGINQVQVNPKINLTFAKTLRAFLRQDPDIIMIGEIRDEETAEIAVQASATGHLVLSTLHSNNAVDTLIRLAHLGISAFSLTNSILVIIAQRLVRILCSHCKKSEHLPEKTLLKLGFKTPQLEHIKLFRPGSCQFCHQGYKGRIGIYEVMPISKKMTKLIMEGKGSLELAAQAQSEHIDDLKQAALKKIALGITSIEELNRVYHTTQV